MYTSRYAADGLCQRRAQCEALSFITRNLRFHLISGATSAWRLCWQQLTQQARLMSRLRRWRQCSACTAAHQQRGPPLDLPCTTHHLCNLQHQVPSAGRKGSRARHASVHSRSFELDALLGGSAGQRWTLGSLVTRLRDSYCGTLALESLHMTCAR